MMSHNGIMVGSWVLSIEIRLIILLNDYCLFSSGLDASQIASREVVLVVVVVMAVLVL